MNDDRVKTVAVIPAYNEEHSIAKVIVGTRRYVDRVIVCDDGSTDMTFMIADALGAKVVRHSEKLGKGEALRTLFKEIMELDADIIVTLDGDGQHSPDEVPMLMKPIETGKSDMVVGSRYVDGAKCGAPFYRKVGLRVINFLYKKIAGVHTEDTQCGFRAYSKKAFEYMMQCNATGYGIEGEQLVLASRNGLRVMEVPVSVKYGGSAQTSKKSPLLHGMDLILTLLRLVIEEKPLKYLGLPGIGLTFMGGMLGVYLLWMFNITRYFSITMAVLTVGVLIVGVLLVFAAITLHRLKGINEKLNRFNEKKR